MASKVGVATYVPSPAGRIRASAQFLVTESGIVEQILRAVSPCIGCKTTGLGAPGFMAASSCPRQILFGLAIRWVTCTKALLLCKALLALHVYF